MREKRIGIPLGLNMWEMAPFWHAFFTELGFETIVSPQSSRTTFLKGQATIPSDTVCFPGQAAPWSCGGAAWIWECTPFTTPA